MCTTLTLPRSVYTADESQMPGRVPVEPAELGGSRAYPENMPS